MYNHDLGFCPGGSIVRLIRLGYVQGMSDIAAVMLEVMEDEVDAFWCFVGVMDEFGWAANFNEDQQGMNLRLKNLCTLLRFVDPSLFYFERIAEPISNAGLMSFFDSQGAAHLLFCFRWLLIMFKREFKFEDVKSIWEVSCYSFFVRFLIVAGHLVPTSNREL